MDRYLGGEDIAHDALTEDLEKAVARATLPSRRTRLLGDRRRLRRAARPRGRRLPLAVGAPVSRRLHSRRRERRADQRRPAGHPGRRGREDHQRPVRRPRQPGAGLLRHPDPGRTRARVRSLHVVLRREPGDHEDHDEDEKIGSLAYPFGRQHVAGRRRWSPGDLVRDRQAQPGRDRRHALLRSTSRGCCGRGRCPSRCCRWRSSPRARPTRTSSRRRSRPARRRGPERARREQPRDPPARALEHGRGPRRRADRAARRPLLGARRDPAVPGVAARDVRRARARGSAGT